MKDTTDEYLVAADAAAVNIIRVSYPYALFPVLCCCNPENRLGFISFEDGDRQGLQLYELNDATLAFSSGHDEEHILQLEGFVEARGNGVKTWKKREPWQFTAVLQELSVTKFKELGVLLKPGDQVKLPAPSTFVNGRVERRFNTFQVEEIEIQALITDGEQELSQRDKTKFFFAPAGQYLNERLGDRKMVAQALTQTHDQYRIDSYNEGCLSMFQDEHPDGELFTFRVFVLDPIRTNVTEAGN